jgi:transposase InsO family protein
VETPSFFDDILAQEIAKDVFFGPLKKRMQGEAMALNKDQDNLLSRLSINAQGWLMADEELVCIPTVLQTQVIAWHHGLPLTGHWGKQRTTTMIKRRYIWNDMESDIENFIKRCTACQARKRKYEANDKRLSTPAYFFPWDCIHIDYAGPYPTSSQGNNWVLYAIDRCTKYAVAWAVPSCNQAHTLACMRKLFTTFGIPRKIYSDNGTHFSGSDFTNFMTAMGVPQQFSAAYHPQANGIAERAVQTFSSQIAIFAQKNEETWDEALACLTYAYNTTINASTQETPYYLLFGRDPLSAADIALCYDINPSEPPTSIHLARLQLRQQAVDEAISRLRKQRDKLIEESTQENQAHTLQEGDLVLLHNPNRNVSKKLQLPWVGPYRIKTIMSNTILELIDIEGRQRPGKVHISRVKRFYSPLPAQRDL